MKFGRFTAKAFLFFMLIPFGMVKNVDVWKEVLYPKNDLTVVT